MPRNQEEATGESQMLVERIFYPESLRQPKLPVPIGHERRGDEHKRQERQQEPKGRSPEPTEEQRGRANNL